MVAKCVKKESPKGKTGDEGNQKRRESARIKTKQRESKELLVRKRVELLDGNDEGSGRKTRANAFRRRVNVENVEEETLIEKMAVDEQEKSCGVSASKNAAADNVAVSASEKAAVPSVADKSAHAKVKETIRLFNKHYLHFVQVIFVSFCIYIIIVDVQFNCCHCWFDVFDCLLPCRKRRRDVQKRKLIEWLRRIQNQRYFLKIYCMFQYVTYFM